MLWWPIGKPGRFATVWGRGNAQARCASVTSDVLFLTPVPDQHSRQTLVEPISQGRQRQH
eukprot:3711877-Pyramimonas_sp.AAC.1